MPENPRGVEHACRIARAALADTVDLTIRIAETPSPTGSERTRAALVSQVLQSHGFAPSIDAIGNVTARYGEHGGPALLLAAHSDTVFPHGTDVSVTRAGDRLRGAGVGDNSLGVAAMITALSALRTFAPDLPVDVIAVATVGEEGLGNLAGMRAAMQTLGERVAAVIAIEGHNLGRVTHAAVGSRRWRIRVTGPGGHSWGAFGQPSAIHGLANIITEITRLDVPTDPKTTYNVGVISGGVSVNTIAPEASALLDMRSVDPVALDRLAQQVARICRQPTSGGLRIEIDVLGERPAGSIDRRVPLVRSAGEILNRLGIEPVYDASSTDANIPISRGIPAVCIGITHGGHGHTTDEYIQMSPIECGLAQLLMLIDAASTAIRDTRAEEVGQR